MKGREEGFKERRKGMRKVGKENDWRMIGNKEKNKNVRKEWTRGITGRSVGMEEGREGKDK